jgi:hypothetical protein
MLNSHHFTGKVNLEQKKQTDLHCYQEMANLIDAFML